MRSFDTFIIGHISLDENIYLEEVEKTPGGAVVASSYSAFAGGNKTALLTKTAKDHKDLTSIFNIPKENVYFVESKKTTSIRNQYLSSDRERRICTALGVADEFKIEEIPNIESKIYHFAGLIAGDFDNEMLKILSKRGKVAADMQGFLRQVEGDSMILRDWKDKKEYLKYVDFLKVDAAEAEVMTGLADRKEAAKQLYDWGAKEIMITHNTEVLIFDGKNFYSKPLKPRNLSGRTGRGDTCFSAYITERLIKNIEESVLYAAALVSLKMETPGPFKGTREDVEAYINEFYK